MVMCRIKKKQPTTTPRPVELQLNLRLVSTLAIPSPLRFLFIVWVWSSWKHGQRSDREREREGRTRSTSLHNANKVAEKAVVLRCLHASSNGSFSLFAFSKGRGLPVKRTKNTFSLFHAALFTSK